MKYRKIIFTNDYLRVYEAQSNLFETPFKNNLRWIKELVGNAISEALNIQDLEYFTADESGAKSIRWRVFNDLTLPFSMSSWCCIFEQVDVSESIKMELKDIFRDSLVISYESSPALLKLYNELGIDYIDIAIHPIRFLDDYVFAIRSNIEHVRLNLVKYKIKDEVCREKARVYKAKSARLDVFQKLPACSALFVGQMDQDSSLIENGRMISLDEVKMHLEEISSNYPKIYYKKHPHNKNTKSIIEFIEKLERIEAVEWNIYDALGSGVFSKVISISSGVLHESKYFDCDSKRLSQARDYYSVNEVQDEFTYHGILRLPMIKDFWESIFYNTPYADKYLYDPYAGAMQKSLNVTWGGRV